MIPRGKSHGRGKRGKDRLARLSHVPLVCILLLQSLPSCPHELSYISKTNNNPYVKYHLLQVTKGRQKRLKMKSFWLHLLKVVVQITSYSEVFLWIKFEFGYFSGMFQLVLKKRVWSYFKSFPYVIRVVIYNSGFKISSNTSGYLKRCHKVFKMSPKKNVEKFLEGCKNNSSIFLFPDLYHAKLQTHLF